MAILAAAAPYIAAISAASGVVTAVQQKGAGDVAEANARNVALQQEQEGKAAQAESQRQAIDERKRSEYLQSRVKATAAASGGSVNDPTIQTILGDIGQEGEYRALSSLYGGDTDAQLAKTQATATRNEGRASRRAAGLKASSTILGTASDFYSKYGSKH